MIEYIEVREKSNREIIGIIDGAKSIIWHTVYYGVGDFEIYAIATKKHIEMLKKGNYITRPNNIEVGIIENISSSYDIDNGQMIIASGRFVKSILDRRHIFNLSGHTNRATILSGNVENAIRKVVSDNAINCAFDRNRNIDVLELGAVSGLSAIIVDENGNRAQKQVSFDNLLEYTEEVLFEYSYGAIVTLNDYTGKFVYTIYSGIDRSVDNTDGNEPVIFSQEYDNLSESKYSSDMSLKKTFALVGGTGEELDRFYSVVNGGETGIERREMWVDAQSISKTYMPDGSEEQAEYSDAEYDSMLKQDGRQKLNENSEQETFEAVINVGGGVWRLNEDYKVGDIVTFQDNALNIYGNVRIVEITEVQDEDGYEVTPVFEWH